MSWVPAQGRLRWVGALVGVLALGLGACSAGAGARSQDGPGSEPTAYEQILMGDPVPPGTYAIRVIGELDPAAPRAIVDIPEGFIAPVSVAVVAGDGAQATAVTFWTVYRVSRHPCRARATNYVIPGPTVQDLAESLTRQRGVRTTEPVPVSLAGHQGLYVEQTAPRGLDQTACYGRSYDYWQSQGGTRSALSAGEVSRLWILEVDGEPLVVDAALGPEATGSARAKVASIVDSLEIGRIAQESG